MNTDNTMNITKQKILGVYPQKQKDLFMQRIKVTGGRITWKQWRTIAQLVQKYTPSTPLHLTTRQDIEMHNICPENVEKIQQELKQVDLTTFSTGGDSIRNITICPGCEKMKNKLDLKKIAASVQDYILSLPCTSDLPRKFKISFSACQTACAKPWLNDLGFIAMPQNRFKVIAAGSMGPKPSLGIELFDDLAIQDILPLAQASVEFFHLHGDRQDRRKARFRHIREKLGDEVFKEQLKERFEKIKKEKTCPKIKPLESDQILTLKYKLNLPNGNISPDDALLLADSAQPFLAQLRINLTHGLEIFADNSFELPHHLAKLADNPVITACPGCSTCPNGIVDCYETADLIRRSLTGSDYSALSINISGCPNNCAHSAAASIGLIGAKKTFGDVTYSAYRIMLGGGNGKNNKLAQFSRTLKSQDISNYINNNFT